MRRLLTWIVVSFGIAALVRRLRRRGERTTEELPPTAPERDPAAELRQKLADTRAEDEPFGEPPVSPEASVEERRGSVHEQGRATVDEMRGDES